MGRRRTRVRTKGRSCTGKPRYASKQRAQDVVRWMVAHGSDPDRAEWYACRFCHGYHTGHSPRGKR